MFGTLRNSNTTNVKVKQLNTANISYLGANSNTTNVKVKQCRPPRYYDKIYEFKYNQC